MNRADQTTTAPTTTQKPFISNTIQKWRATTPTTTQESNTANISKLDTLANALLAGEHITGLQMMNDFHIASYRDSVLTLRKRGMNITTAYDKHKDGRHGRYYMSSEAINAYNERVEGVA